MNNTKLSLAVSAFALSAILLTGCSVAAESTPDPAASAASTPTEDSAEPAAEETVNPLIKPFGEIVTYEDGVSISVSPGASFTPGEYAQGAESGTPLVFKVIITNNSDVTVEPAAIPSATSGGQPATYIADVANPEYGDLGMFPTTTLLPGQTIEWYTAFAVADPADVTYQISPTSFDYDSAIFTTVK